MGKVKETSLESLASILKRVESFQNSRSFSWYRGVGNEAHGLLPSLLRKSPTPTPEELIKLEKAIGNSFSQRSPPFIHVDLSSEWKMLFYMQHYGIPTRLLDWSESPFVGLYFALTSVKRDESGKPLHNVALWLCDPEAWNRSALSHITFAGSVLDESSEGLKAYSPSSDVDQRATIPIMIYGTHNSPRIVAQRGVFALFGKGVEGMEVTFENGSFPNGCLEKIVIAKDKVDEILTSLHRKGFAESTIYPDLFGLSMEIRRSYGYH